MKKVIIALILLIAIGTAGFFIWYELYFPKMVAEAVVMDNLPPYIPKHIQLKIDEFRKPVNASAEMMIAKMHSENIPFEKIIETIDHATEEQTNGLIDELSTTNITGANQVFDIGKKYFPVNYDVEVFREPFVQNVDLRVIKKGIRYAKANRRTNDIDLETLKEIARRLLIEKEKEYQRKAAGY